jgi:hypothetical protein
VAKLLVVSVVTLAVGSIVVVATTGVWRNPGRAWAAPVPESLMSLVWRGALSSAFYLVCYITAGLIIFPWVRGFYATKQMPSPVTMVALQLFVRGPMFVGVIALVGRLLSGSRRLHALAGGAVMSILGGVVPLMVPNMFFPDAVRWVHFCEVGSSNFVFGAVTGWLMSPTRAILPAPSAAADTPVKEIAHEQAR